MSSVPVFNVLDYGARGDGISLDSPAVNAALAAAAAAGGGTVRLPRGRYRCFTLHLVSRLTLEFSPGAVIVAAVAETDAGRYDDPEPNLHSAYQDFGHSHWRNSLMWGEDLEDITITGPGLIDGTDGLVPFGPGSTGDPGLDPERSMDGLANKAIALRRCRQVRLSGFSMLNGGHFAVLATGVDQLVIEGLVIDTARDGLDIDCCRHVQITGCHINSPHDDAIVLKSSFALGQARATEHVTIADCTVSGYDLGTLLDGTRGRTFTRAPDGDGPTGRIKLGTESNGGFRHIVIRDCVFDRSRGLALETVDGGVMEDVVATRLTMRDLSNSPIFIRLGHRARGPAGTPVGRARRIHLSHITVEGGDGRFPIIIAGVPGHPIEDVTLEDIYVRSEGGITMAQVAAQPADLINLFFQGAEPVGTTGPREPFDVPERERGYPEPCNFGLLPASALYARHVRNLVFRRGSHHTLHPDERPAVVLEDAHGIRFESFAVPRSQALICHTRNVTALNAVDCTWSPA